MKADQVVNKLLETDVDSPDANLNRYARALEGMMPLELRHEANVIRQGLTRIAHLLSQLTRFSGIDQRDEAVENLSHYVERLETLTRHAALNEKTSVALLQMYTDLHELLESDSYAKPEDAIIVKRVVAELASMLK